MNNPECFVPSCKNKTGVAFPKETDLKEKWLEALQIKNNEPDEESFICLEHFNPTDVLDFSLNQLKEDAVPFYFNLESGEAEEETKATETEVYSGEESTRKEERTIEQILEEKSSETLEDILREKVNETIDDSIEDFLGETNESISNVIQKEQESRALLMETTTNIPEETTTDIIDQNDVIEPEQEMINETQQDEIGKEPSEDVNLCENVENEATGGNEQPQESHNVENLNENNVNEQTDNDPALLDSNSECTDKTCRLCMKTGNIEHSLTDNLEDHVTIKNAINECLYPMLVSEEDDFPQQICETCCVSLLSYYKFRMQCFLVNNKLQINRPGSPKKRTFSSSDEEVFIKKKIKPNDESQNAKEPMSPPPLVLINNKLGEITVKPVPADKQKTFRNGVDSGTVYKNKKVEAELWKVLEGKLMKDLRTTENIIISVESDDEEPEKPKATAIKSKYNVTRLSLPLKANTIVTDKAKKILPKERQQVKIPAAQSIPKGIRLRKYESAIGWFPCKTVPGIYDSEFLLADNYLFEYRLSKENVRFVRCVVATCPAVGYQRQLGSSYYERKINVQTAHNHETPNIGERKKQMFYYVMKRKMQSDKTLNFRSVYDEVCKIDPEIKRLVPLRSVINEICRHQLTHKLPNIRSFEEFYNMIEEDAFQKLHFTHNGKQFYQEKLTSEDGSQAIVFGSQEIIEKKSNSKLMYVDASFKIDTCEPFSYQLLTVLVWVEDSYYPIMFALVSRKSQEIFRQLFAYLHDILAPQLRPEEIVTDYEATLYYALGETYIGSHIGGSCFYYTQNLYKKVCTLNLSRDLETNSYFRNLYHMLLMLPLLPVNTIVDGLNNIENQIGTAVQNLAAPLFEHVRNEWINKVSPELFCVHRLENRINENVIAPFKKLRDFLMLTKGKIQKQPSTIINVVEKLIELEAFLRTTYSNSNKKSFARDLSSSQKKNVIRAWQYIENHPKININNFFTKVLGYIKCMENQLWIWGFYRFKGETNDELINAINFTLVNFNENENEERLDCESENGDEIEENNQEELNLEKYQFKEIDYISEEAETGDEHEEETVDDPETVVVEAVIDENGGFVLTKTIQQDNAMEMEQVVSDSEIIEHDLNEVQHQHQYEGEGVVEQDVTDTIHVENSLSKDSMTEQIMDTEDIQPESANHFEQAFLKYVYK